MSEKEYNGLMWALNADGLNPTMKRATLVAIYYSLPSNQNASEGGGSTIIPQKIIPWGENAEPRVYVSPYTLKRNIRNYWVKTGLNVGYRERIELIEDVKSNGKVQSIMGNNDINKSWKDFIDYDLFGWVAAEGNSSVARPGPINTWGAVSVETLHDFTDFNTSIKNVREENRGKGGGIFNRQISKEFYFTSFSINPDMVSAEIYKEGNKLVAEVDITKRKERLKEFLKSVLYAMQKESGPRDRPACVFAAIMIEKANFPTWDKKFFKNLEVTDNGEVINIKNWEKIKETTGTLYIYHLDEDRVKGVNLEEKPCSKEKLEECLDKIVNDLTSQ